MPSMEWVQCARMKGSQNLPLCSLAAMIWNSPAPVSDGVPSSS